MTIQKNGLAYDCKDNVHQHEIIKFGSKADRWWDAQGEFKTFA